MARFLILIGAFWLAAAFWHDTGGDVSVIWMALLPATYLVALTSLKN